jgi:hypothetical protein
MSSPISIRQCAIVLSLGFAASTAGAQVNRSCERLTGVARTQCLSAEATRTSRDAERANAQLAQLNQRMSQACEAMDAANRLANAASVAGSITQVKPLSWGGRTWTSVTSIMSYVTGTRRGCEEARSAVAAARQRN